MSNDESCWLGEKIGVNCNSLNTLHIYGRVNWSTEPWIISLGKNVHITDGVKFLTHDGGTLLYRNIIPDLEITKPITIGDDVYIGNNVILLPGVNIGNNVIIGAGAVVSRDIPSNSVAVGVPAKVIRYRYTKPQIEALNRIMWWEWDDETISERHDDFYIDIDSFIKKYES